LSALDLFKALKILSKGF